MGLYDQFPYRNFHELNADWLIKQASERKAKIEDFQQQLEDFQDDYNQLLRLAAALNISGSNVTIAGTLTAGALVGNLTGNVTGNVSGNASTATNATNATNAANATNATNADYATMSDFSTNSNLAAAAAKTKLDTDLHTSTDANDFIPPTDGLYVYQVDALNSNVPGSQQGEAAVLLTIRYGTDHVLQVAWFYVNSQDLYYRQKYYNSWQGWYKITTTYGSGI